MADYDCSPLWWNDEDKVGNIDPQDLPLKSDTVARLNAWAESYDATLNWDDPATSSGFETAEAEEAFEREGIFLWQQLQKELAPIYKVSYFSDRQGKLLEFEQEIPFLGDDLLIGEFLKSLHLSRYLEKSNNQEFHELEIISV